jgi:hypothetical protein
VTENRVDGNVRRLTVTRDARGISSKHANFTLTDTIVPIISAIGSTATLEYHVRKTAATLALWPTNASKPVCLCRSPAAAFGKSKGKIKYIPTGEEFGFIDACQPEPRESVLHDRNPTCDILAYTGGLQVC